MALADEIRALRDHSAATSTRPTTITPIRESLGSSSCVSSPAARPLTATNPITGTVTPQADLAAKARGYMQGAR